ncbi:MAG: alpha/beta hydrolase [Pseudomonadota bacterium]
MKETSIILNSRMDQIPIHVYVWWPDAPPTRTIVIAHGLAEHAARYRRFAEALTAQGYIVYGIDHRGHGNSVLPGCEPGDLGKAGWQGLCDDLVMLMDQARSDHMRLPLVLFGHSMGSFIAQQVCQVRSKKLDAVILSGSTRFDLTTADLDTQDDSEFSLADFNAAFEPARTPYDWLSRDLAEVDSYIDDPLCGFDLPASIASAFAEGGKAVGDTARIGQIRKDLPVLFVAGEADPLNAELALLNSLEAFWRVAGIQDISTQYYPEGRHEMLNELNRDEVTQNMLTWLDEKINKNTA